MPNMDVWKARIYRSMSIQQRQHNLWKDSLALYNCQFFSNVYGGFDPERVDVHFANWYVDNLVPLVYFRDPFLFIKPSHDQYASFADTMETLLNKLWHKLHLKQQFKRVIKSGFLMPPGWMKLGYTAKIGQDVARLEEEQTKTLMQDIKQVITGKLKERKELTPEEQGVINEYIEEENIFATWIPSWNVLMPEGYQLVSQMPYLIEIEDVPKVDFLANPVYKNKDKAKETRSLSIDETGGRELRKPTYNKLGSASAGTQDEETTIIRLFHIRDKRSQKRLTISMDSSEPHFEGKWPYDMEGFDLKPLIFDETLPSSDSSNPYPPNVILPILPQVIEQSGSRTQMVKWRKRAGVIILAQKGIITEEDMRQIEKTEGVQLCLVSNIGAFQMAQVPNMPQGVFNVDQVIKQDLQMATNMGQMMFQPQPGQRTATQAQIGQSGLQLKSSARVDVVEDYTVDIAISIAQLAWQFFDKRKVQEIISEQVTDQMWLPLPKDPKERKRIIRSELQFRIDAGSTAPPKDETTDRKQFLDAISIAASFAPERLKKDESLKAMFKTFKYIPDIERIVISMDDDERRVAQEENRFLDQNLPQVVGPNENHEIHIQVNSQGQPTEARDIHITEHGRYMGITPKPGAGATPQAGDRRPPMKSVAPEITRQGMTRQGDVYQSAQNLGVGTGQEAI